MLCHNSFGESRNGLRNHLVCLEVGIFRNFQIFKTTSKCTKKASQISKFPWSKNIQIFKTTSKCTKKASQISKFPWSKNIFSTDKKISELIQKISALGSFFDPCYLQYKSNGFSSHFTWTIQWNDKCFTWKIRNDNSTWTKDMQFSARISGWLFQNIYWFTIKYYKTLLFSVFELTSVVFIEFGEAVKHKSQIRMGASQK